MVFGFLKKKKTDPQQALRQVVGEYEVPKFPAALQQVSKVLRDPRKTYADVAEVVATDPGLTVHVLKVINSAAYKFRHPVEDLAHAISLLGRSNLESIVLSFALRKAAPHKSTEERHAFWHASALRAASARELAKMMHPATADQSYLAALLQDMAVPLLSHCHPTEYQQLLEHWSASQNADLADLERSVFPWDHAEVATWLCDEWQLPETLALAIGSHHAEEQFGACPLPAVTLVNTIKMTGTPDDIGSLVERACGEHGLDSGALSERLEVAKQAAESMAAIYT